ncbi:MAG: ABC transporter ATP-binding protein/permease [Clostridia bacterium]|nr:ABC transporter ATP-binding protein/permease [Clostridia bacterium]
MIKRLAKCVREYKLPTILTLIFIVLEAVIESIIPFITSQLVNNIKAGAVLGDIIRTGLLLAGMAIISLCCGGAAGFTSAKASAGFSTNLRHDLFEKIQTYSFSNIDKFSSSSLVTRLTTDVTNVQMSYMMLIRIAVRAPLMLVFSVIMAYVMGGALATTFVIVIPVLAFGLILIARKAMPAFTRVFRKYDKLNESIEENVRAMRVVKGFSREEYEKAKFKTASDDICADFTKAERIVALNAPLMQICIYFNMAVVLIIGSRIVITSGGSTIDIGELSSMLTYGFQILMQLMMLSMIYVILTMSAESAKRISEVLSEVPTIQNPENAVTEVSDGSIEFENVYFAYTIGVRRQTLENVNIRIGSGMTVGILGGTGSGKSSFARLIPRLYDVTSGTVKVGGVDVRDYDITALRSAVSMVLQKNLIFSGTISENLRWGDENATDDEIRAACELAQADGFISSFPDGYETKIEQGGTNVSGGQKQRICIARALLKKPKILILDDSTSAVDTKTDALIRAGFDKYIPDTTRIIVAQRVSSVQNADMIIVMDNGRIESVGKHDELLKSSPIYREIYEQQTRGGDSDEQ